MRKVFIVAGDPSGDLVAAQLVESMRKMEPDLYVTGVGGERLKKVSDRFLENIVCHHALGFAISLQTILYFKNVLNNIIIPELKNNPPDALIPVDFYGFNWRVAKAAKALGCRVFYYVSPQFWASRPGRAEKLRKVVDLFLCLFPFEAEFYRDRQLPAKFVGHPILDRIPFVDDGSRQPRVESNIGLLPGSRPAEIKRHLPVMLEACRLIHEAHPATRFFLFTVPHVSRDLYKKIIDEAKPSHYLLDMIQDDDYSWRSQLDLAITASGMETLENTFLGIPMVIMYKTNWITYCVAWCLIKTKYIGLPNILAKSEIVPEFVQWKVDPAVVAAPLIKWLKNPEERSSLRKKLLSIRSQFGEGGASDRAARTILEKVA